MTSPIEAPHRAPDSVEPSGALLAAWCVALSISVGTLQLAGRGLPSPPLAQPNRLGDWLEAVEPAEAVVSTLRILALGASWYLLAVTLFGALVRVCHWAGAIGTVDMVTPRFLTRLLDMAGTWTVTGLTFVGSTVLAVSLQPADDRARDVQAAAAERPARSRVGQGHSPGDRQPRLPGDPELVDGDGAHGAAATGSSTPLADPAEAELTIGEDLPPVTGAGRAPEPEPAGSDRPDAAASDPTAVRPPETWTVEPGDHFWNIALEVLRDDVAGDPDTGTVARYWLRLIEANRDRLTARDNPDLLYPGQVLVLPARERGSDDQAAGV